MIASGVSDPVLFTLIAAAVAVIGMSLLWLLAYNKRDRKTILRKYRVGVFIERDLMNAEDLPKQDPWPGPVDDAVPHDSPTEEDWPQKR